MTFRPMLACKMPRLEDLRYPLLASYKMDGIRAVMRDGVLMSRSMKPLPNAAIQKRLSGFAALEGLDGELIVGPHDNSVYRRTMSAVMRVSDDPTDATIWWIFDRVGDGSFENRLARAEVVVKNTPHIRVLPHRWVTCEDDVLATHQAAVENGFEGLILRDPAGLYKQGRSTAREQGMVKVKMFDDSEAEILGWVELMHNANEATTSEIGLTKRSSHKANKVATGKMGALKVRDRVTEVEFEIGTGFTDGDRANTDQWWVGRIVKYKFFAGGVKDKPRFPVFLGFRDARDM